MRELRESIKKRAEVFRIIGLSAMGTLGLDFINIVQTCKGLHGAGAIINLMLHVAFFIGGRFFLSQSFKILEEEEEQNGYK